MRPGHLAGSGGGRRAYRTPAGGRRPTIFGSCSARRRGTWPPVRASASRARRRQAGAGSGTRARWSPDESTQRCPYLRDGEEIHTVLHGRVTVTVAVTVGGAVSGSGPSVRTDVVVGLFDGSGLSSSTCPSARPSTKIITAAMI